MPEVGVSEERVLLYDHLLVKFNDPKLKNEIFVRINMKHSFFLNCLFAIHFFCCSNCCCLPKIYSCLCIIFVLIV